MHSKHICHRDIKLDNIIINEANEVKLIDFGFAITVTSERLEFCGTPSYMAPEIVTK